MMGTKDFLPIIYDNFEVFYTMGLASTLTSTYNCKESDEDSHKIITFIGEAFELSQEIITEFESLILGDMMNIGLVTDYQAISSTELLSQQDKENIELYEIKGRILEEIAVIESQGYYMADARIANQVKAHMKYEYFHHPYNAKMRFWHFNRLAKNGIVEIVRQVGILLTLGIGCDIDYEKAEENFLKCILWGDRFSTVLLNQLYSVSGKGAMELNKVSEYCNLMKLLSAYIIAPKRNPLINDELANVLISDTLSYRDKAELIMNFSEKAWRSVFMLSNNKKNQIGFRVRRDE